MCTSNPRIKNSILFIFFLLNITAANAQTKQHTISGIVKDKTTGEALIGANIILLQQKKLGGTSNAYGFYSINIIDGDYTIVTSFSGYQSDTIVINLQKNIDLLITLKPISTDLQTIIITNKKRDYNVTNPVMGIQRLSMAEINNIPVLFGEKDILKTIQLLPGIKSAGDGNTGFYVRGGAADQNLILLDEATVYNASHLLGFFSTFNSDAIKDVTIYKGGMPAEYGGRLSSVMDVKMNDGNNQKLAVSGGIGLISSRLNIEAPIVKDKGSFTISARRTYADLFLKLSKDSTNNKNSLYFYDINAKANYKISKKDRIYLSGYFGKDMLSFSNTFGINWGNTTATARWNHVYNSQLFSNTSLIYSDYNYTINIDNNTSQLNLLSHIHDIAIKEDLQYYFNPNSTIKFGVNIIHHTFSPGIINASQNASYNSLLLPKNYSLENAAYINHEWNPFKKIHINYGIRFTLFSVIGPGNFYTFDSFGNTIDTLNYGSGKVVKNYFNAEPRFSTSFVINNSSSIKISYTRNVQNLHLLSNSTSSNPTDLWVSSSNNIKPEIADQEAIGFFKNFKDNSYEFSTELYYKNMQNQIDYKNGAQLVFNKNVESQLLYGIGKAYGAEFFLKKKEGKFTGWISYTLSKTELKINGINNNSWYPAKQDETHNIALVGIYKANNRWTLSATWVYNTGNAVTFPSGKYNVNGQVVFYYTERNGYRMPAYHRLDLGATLIQKKTKKFESSWTFSIYNTYNHANAYSINFQQDPNDASKTQAVQYSLFKIVPSITYNFKFK